MTARARGRWAALVALAAATLLPLTAARRMRARWDRGLAARDASAAAGYLAIVTPMARSGGGYDLPQLLIRARALAGLPGLAVDFEIYDRTAPLVHATAPPLLPAVLEQLRREVAVRWTGEAMLAPLLDRDGWDVVGAVAAQPQGAGWPVSPWSFAALLLFVAAGVQAVRAVGAVRLGPGRWVELRARPLEAGTAPWLAVVLGLAALGPLGALLAGWSLAASPRQRRETVAAWGFLAPSALHLVAFTVGPLLFALYLSVHRFSPVEPARPLIGLAGYAQALGNPLVWAALGRTLLYACYVPVSVALALALALLLRGRSRGARLARTLFFLPAVSSVVAVALVWRWMYQPDVGLVNHLLGHLLGHPFGQLLTRAGLGRVDWVGDPAIALIAVMIVSVWTQLGYQMAVFHAGLENIPRAYVDAARVDGAY